MSLDLFRVTKGLAIEDDAFTTGSSNAYVLQGGGLPGGDTGVEDAAPIGSLYMRTDAETNNLQLYYKWTTANNSSVDWRVVADKTYVDSIALGLSWREPVVSLDNTLYASNANFPAGSVNGERVLFTNVTAAGEKNVWIWNSGLTAWVEDTNAESDGDALMVQTGTYAETQWVFDGTNWVQMSSSSSNTELQYIRDFIGKDAPGPLPANGPVYTSTNVVTAGATLEAAIGELDAGVGSGAITNDVADDVGIGDGKWALTDDLDFTTRTITTAINELNNAVGNRLYTNNFVIADGEVLSTSLNKVDSAFGVGTFTNVGGNWALTANLNYTTRSVTTALNELNQKFGDGTFATTSVLTSGNDVTTSLEKLDATYGAGAITNQGGVYPLTDDMVWNTALSGTLTLTTALNAINNAVGNITNITNEFSGTINNPVAAVIDGILATDATEVKWMVQVRQNAAPANRRAFEVHAMHNGAATDNNIYSRLVTGAGVNGVAFAVALTDIGGGVIHFQLLLSATGNVDYVVKRISYSAF